VAAGKSIKVVAELFESIMPKPRETGQMTMPKSPKIISLVWGKIEVEGYPAGKDFVLYPGGAECWNWNDTGTTHAGGIQPQDIDKLLAKSANKIVLTTGMTGRLRVSDATLERLKNAGVEFMILNTDEAVEVYNRLAQEWQVGGLFHSTC
jgi:hypothetical protein